MIIDQILLDLSKISNEITAFSVSESLNLRIQFLIYEIRTICKFVYSMDQVVNFRRRSVLKLYSQLSHQEQESIEVIIPYLCEWSDMNLLTLDERMEEALIPVNWEKDYTEIIKEFEEECRGLIGLFEGSTEVMERLGDNYEKIKVMVEFNPDNERPHEDLTTIRKMYENPSLVFEEYRKHVYIS